MATNVILMSVSVILNISWADQEMGFSRKKTLTMVWWHFKSAFTLKMEGEFVFWFFCVCVCLLEMYVQCCCLHSCIFYCQGRDIRHKKDSLGMYSITMGDEGASGQSKIGQTHQLCTCIYIYILVVFIQLNGFYRRYGIFRYCFLSSCILICNLS